LSDIFNKEKFKKIDLYKMNEEYYAPILYAYNIHYNYKYGDIDTLKFKIPLKINVEGQIEDYYVCDIIKPFYLIKYDDSFFIIIKIDRYSEGGKEYFEIDCKSRAYQLKYKNVRSFKTGTPDNPVKNLTGTMELLLEGTNWSVDEVNSDVDIINKYRAVDIPDSNVLDAITTICEKWDCIPKYDTINRKISFVDYRTDGYFTGLYITKGKYLKNINFTMNESDIITKLKVFGKNDISIQQVNLSGQNYITDYSYFRDEMSIGLKNGLDNYKVALENKSGEFQFLLNDKSVLQIELFEKETELDFFSNDSTYGLYPFEKLRDVKIANGENIKSETIVITNGNVVSATSNTAILNLLDIPSNLKIKRKDCFNGLTLKITEGRGFGQRRTITSYNPDTRKVTLSSGWSTIPDNTSKYEITNTSVNTEYNRRKNLVYVIEEDIDDINNQIVSVDSQINTLRLSLDISNFLTSEQIKELNDFTFEGTFIDNSITERLKEDGSNTIEVLEELLYEAQKYLQLNNQPRYSAEIDIINFMQSEDYRVSDLDKNALQIGNKIKVRYADLDIDIMCKIVEIDHDVHRHKLNIRIANDKDIKEGFLLLKDFLKTTQSNNKLVNESFGNWREGGEARNIISNYMKSAIDVTQQAIMNSKSNVQWNSRGIIMVDVTNPQYQSLYTSNGILLSDNGGEDWNIAIGKGKIFADVLGGKWVIANQVDANGIDIWDGENKVVEIGTYGENNEKRGIRINAGALEITGGLPDSQIASAETWKANIQNAQNAANNANELLADIANDNKLTAVEKQEVKKEWDSIVAEKTLLESQATAYGITTDKTNYINAYNALDTYLTSNNLLADLTSTSDIVGVTFRSKFSDYYKYKIILMNAITNALKASSVQLGQLYNNLKFDSVDGITATRSDNKIRTLLNATDGFKIQKGNGDGTFPTDLIYLDTNGNANFKGVVDASDFKIDGMSILTNGKIKGGYIEAKGILVGSEFNPYFKVDEDTGKVTMNDATITGNFTMTGGSISWENVNTEPIDNAQNTADSAYNIANSAYSRAGTALSNIDRLANGTFTGYTFIDGTTISSPTVRGGYVVGGKFFAVDNPNANIVNNDIPNVKRLIIDSSGIVSKNNYNEISGIKLSSSTPVDGFGTLQYYYRGELRGSLYHAGGNIHLKAEQRLLLGNDNPSAGNKGDVLAIGKWNFSYATEIIWGNNAPTSVAVFG